MPLLKITEAFKEFIENEKSSGLLLIACTIIALLIANSNLSQLYLNTLHLPFLGLSLEHWVNDGLMAIFFLFIGLELERELYNGELSNVRQAMLPIAAAIGGIAAPALIHLYFNFGLPTQAGIGIPMATDIAFAIGVLSMLGNRIPMSLKVFVVAFAIVSAMLTPPDPITMMALWVPLVLLYLLGVLLVFLLVDPFMSKESDALVPEDKENQ